MELQQEPPIPGFVPVQGMEVGSVVLPDHIRLLLFVHTCRKHSCVTFVHRVRDLVWEQMGPRAVVHVEDPSAPGTRPTHAGEDAHEVRGLGEATQRDLVRAVAGQVQRLPRREGAHDAVVLLQQQGWSPGVRAPPGPGLPRHAAQEESLWVREAQVG